MTGPYLKQVEKKQVIHHADMNLNHKSARRILLPSKFCEWPALSTQLLVTDHALAVLSSCPTTIIIKAP